MDGASLHSQSTRSLDDLEAEITELAGHLNAARHRWLALIAEFDRRNGWSDGACHSCAHWLNFKCGVALGAAREKVRVAHALENFPKISAAMSRGELSYSKVRALTRIADAGTEDYLLSIALHGTAHHVERVVQHFRRAQEAEELSREARQQAGRSVSYLFDDDGSLVLKARLPAEIGALLIKALDAAMEEISTPDVPAGTPDFNRPSPPPDESPSRAARRADAVALLAESFLKHGGAALSGGERHQIVVHVDAQTLRDDTAGQCEIEDGPALPAETVRRLACDSSVVLLVESEQGEPLNVGRKTRSIPPAFRRALNARDRGCRFPGCTHTRYVDAHHVHHWAHGGETKASNLVTLCRFHHRKVHEGGVTFYPHIGSVRIDGPANASAATDSPSRLKIFTCHPMQASEEEACARDIATTLARRAYRGEASRERVDTLMEFYAIGRRGGSFDDGVEAIVQRVLVDPRFVYRMESTPANLAPGAAYRVSNLDLASRLSFFLWSSIPDDTLLQLAASGQLSQTEVLRQQVRRMLADPRASALTKNFAGQWLGLRNLAAHAPVVDQFPDFDDNLRQAFRREVELLFGSLLEENRSVLDLLTADYTFVNERLAKHYGIPGVRGSEFRRVKLDGSQSARWGLLGKGEFLTVSSQPGRTSPVIRGNWVLRNIFGVPAPDPPPDVPALKAKPGDAAGNAKPPSMREQMVQHRSDPKCQGCHKLMDPIGFALEPFDAIGRWRTEDGGNPIDARSEMYDGTPVEGPGDVRAFLLKYQDQYLRNVTQNLMTYALGRGMEYDDMPTVRGVLHTAQNDGYRLKSLVEAVVMSDVFRMNVASGE